MTKLRIVTHHNRHIDICIYIIYIVFFLFIYIDNYIVIVVYSRLTLSSVLLAYFYLHVYIYSTFLRAIYFYSDSRQLDKCYTA